jgi:hypothetical protein
MGRTGEGDRLLRPLYRLPGQAHKMDFIYNSLCGYGMVVCGMITAPDSDTVWTIISLIIGPPIILYIIWKARK